MTPEGSTTAGQQPTGVLLYTRHTGAHIWGPRSTTGPEFHIPDCRCVSQENHAPPPNKRSVPVCLLKNKCWKWRKVFHCSRDVELKTTFSIRSKLGESNAVGEASLKCFVSLPRFKGDSVQRADVRIYGGYGLLKIYWNCVSVIVHARISQSLPFSQTFTQTWAV